MSDAFAIAFFPENLSRCDGAFRSRIDQIFAKNPKFAATTTGLPEHDIDRRDVGP